MTKFLSIKQVLVIHSNLITQFGGSKGIRSMNSLESALYRMMASFDGYDLYKSIFEKAAALFESILKNHPFVDGNKRTAFLSSAIFLEINAYKTKFDNKETEKFILEIIGNTKTFKDIVLFFSKNSKKTF